MKDIVHSNNGLIKGTFLEQVLDECDVNFVQVLLRGLGSLDLLGCSLATNYCSDFVSCFEGGNKSSETKMAIRAGDLEEFEKVEDFNRNLTTYEHRLWRHSSND
jgi:hypothetical protein